MAEPHVAPRYRLLPELKIRREAFGGILYKYGCADRGALSFINSPALIELLLTGQREHEGDLDAAIAARPYSANARQKLYGVLDELARRGYVLVGADVEMPTRGVER